MSEKECVSTVCEHNDGDGSCTFGDGTGYCTGRESDSWSIEDDWQDMEIASRNNGGVRSK